MLTVLVGTEGRHLFEGCRDPRVHVVPAAMNPEIVVYPCSRHRRFEHLAALTAPPDGALLIFDTSLEGIPHKPDITAALHAQLARWGVSPRRCVYVTQERRYAADYSAHCAVTGLESVAVLVHDYWIWRSLEVFAERGAEIYEARLNAFRARPGTRRRYLTLNRTPRPSKVVLLLRLLRDRLWDQGLVSFGGFQSHPGAPGKPKPTSAQLLAKLPGFEDLIAELMPYIETLDGYGRRLFGDANKFDLETVSVASELPEFHQSWFSVVADTEMRSWRSRITEKVIKPLVNFHPMLVFGNPGALEMVRKYGFETFSPWYDESYDEEFNPRRRFEMVYAELVRLCALDDAALARQESAMTDVLRFNASWGLTTFPTQYRASCDAELVDRLLAAMRETEAV